jgi:hypothetical protein
VRVEGIPSGSVDVDKWMDLIESHSGVLTVGEAPDPVGHWVAAYTVSLPVHRAGQAIDLAIGLIKPADPRFEVCSLEAMTFEEQDRRD